MPFESSANQIAHEMDECNDEPQFVHVPHLRAIDEKSLFACDATVDLEARPVVRPEESLRVRDVSEDPANLHHGQCCCCRERERQISNDDASLDLLLFGTSDVGRGRNRLVGGSGELPSFKSPAYRSGDRLTQ